MLHMDSLKAIFRILSKEVTLCLCMRVGSHLKMMHFNSRSLVGKLMSGRCLFPSQHTRSAGEENWKGLPVTKEKTVRYSGIH